MVDRRTFRRRSKALILAVAVASGIALLPASPAPAHVHGITPLRCVGVADDGANRVDTIENFGGPIGPGDLIPRDVGKSPLDVGDGGFNTPACPAN
jgi:hypothetical protein